MKWMDEQRVRDLMARYKALQAEHDQHRSEMYRVAGEMRKVFAELHKIDGWHNVEEVDG